MSTLLETTGLDKKYNIVKLSVLQSHQVSARTALVAKNLTTPHESGKTTICCLHTKARTANKLISIVEITKRDLVSQGVKIYQYNALSSEIVSLETSTKQPAQKDTKKNGTEAEMMDDEAEEDAFQTMNQKEQKEKIRAVPVLTVYLCTEPVKTLQHAYG